MNATEMRELNKKIVIETAIKCFIENGITNTSVGMIAEKAGLNLRTVTRNFDTKENIIAQAAIQYLKRSEDWMKATVEKAEFKNKNGLEKILFLLQEKADFLAHRPRDILFINDLETFFDEDGNGEDLVVQYCRAVEIHKLTMHKLYKKGIADGSITTDVTEEKVILLLTGVYKGLVQRLAIAYVNKKVREYTEPEEEIELFIDMVRRYIGKQKQG